MESGRESRVLSALELPVFFPRFFRRRGHQGVFTFLPRFRETIPPNTRSLVLPSIRGEIENRTKFLFFFFWKQTIFLNRFQERGIGNDFFKTNRYVSRAFVTKYFEIIFSASLFKNSLDEPRNGEERKIAKGKNDKSVGRYSIRIGRRVSRLVEGWRKARGPTIGKQDCWWSAKQELAETRKCRSRIPISHDPTAAIRAPQYSVFLCTAVIIITPAGAFLSLHPHLALRGDPCGERKKEGGRAFLHSSPPLSTFSRTFKLESFLSFEIFGKDFERLPFREKRSKVARIF